MGTTVYVRQRVDWLRSPWTDSTKHIVHAYLLLWGYRTRIETLDPGEREHVEQPVLFFLLEDTRWDMYKNRHTV